jgi:hypothetical protein
MNRFTRTGRQANILRFSCDTNAVASCDKLGDVFSNEFNACKHKHEIDQFSLLITKALLRLIVKSKSKLLLKLTIGHCVRADALSRA